MFNIKKIFSSQKPQYKCESCGKVHEDWPSLAYNEPSYYSMLDENEKKDKAKLSSDFCVIIDEKQTDRFIRGTLFQKVNDECQELHYGPWISLSEKSFEDYRDNYHNENHEVVYFGWLSNNLEGYTDTLSVPCDVVTKKGNARPEIIPHGSFDHELVVDYYNGISKTEAEFRIDSMIKKAKKS